MSNLMQMLKPKTKAQTTTLFAWALIAPAALVMFWIVVWPLYETFRLSFTNSNLGTLMGGAEYIGWENYEKAICLLYTSPSPRDRTRSRMPSSA